MAPSGCTIIAVLLRACEICGARKLPKSREVEMFAEVMPQKYTIKIDQLHDATFN
jgi:hypothetical protein